MLGRLLGEEGFAVTALDDLPADPVTGGPYDVIVLDRSLPGGDGLGLLAGMRSRGDTTPVLVLSARNVLADRVAGLDAGAEDYLGKPFDVEELLARLRALLRRRTAPRRLRLPDGRVLDVEARRVDPDGVVLTGREVLLLALLAGQPGRVHDRSALRHAVFAGADTDNVVDTYVSALRRKLGREIIVTVYGVGFRLG